MADQDRDRDSGMSGSGSQSQSDSQQDRNTQNTPRGDNAQGEQDDVAEDRNLSGSSTWLNLPDQPKGDQSEDSEDRQSNR